MKGSIPDTQDETGRTSLHQAAVKGDVDEVGFLLSSGANPNTQDAHLQTPVTLAAERGLYEVVKALAEHDATDINRQDSFGRTPLHWCAKRCDLKAAKVLLGTGKASVNVRTTGGDTALHWACSAGGGSDAVDTRDLEEGSCRVVELLIGAGADVGVKNDRGEKPVDLVTNESVLALLVSAAQELDKREEEEAAEAERKSAPETSSNTLSTATATATATATRPTGPTAGWPTKQQQQQQQGAGTASKAFTKQQGVASGPTAGAAAGTKKKIVIKLKKKP
ncbi:unnamed protein product [Ectocarpus fasciculatus]